jgi:hypothetical protein
MSVGGIDSNTNALKGLSSAIFQREIFGMILFDLNLLDMFFTPTKIDLFLMVPPCGRRLPDYWIRI